MLHVSLAIIISYINIWNLKISMVMVYGPSTRTRDKEIENSIWYLAISWLTHSVFVVVGGCVWEMWICIIVAFVASGVGVVAIVVTVTSLFKLVKEVCERRKKNKKRKNETKKFGVKEGTNVTHERKKK